jgi:hypothetical protein
LAVVDWVISAPAEPLSRVTPWLLPMARVETVRSLASASAASTWPRAVTSAELVWTARPEIVPFEAEKAPELPTAVVRTAPAAPMLTPTSTTPWP